MRILVAEDRSIIAAALCHMLRHYAVDVASNGRQAWRLLETYDYDLAIFEEGLTGIDGISLCQQTRHQGQQMPILLIAATSDGHRKSIGLDAGADDYMVQPIDAEELVARVRALLRRGRLTQQPILQWGLLQLESRRRLASYGQRAINLTPKEYSLLELLLADSPSPQESSPERRVFSYNAIIEHLWMGDDSPGEEAVRTHVKGLRHKLKGAGVVPDPIETVYGVGYRLRAVPLSPRPPLRVLIADPEQSLLPSLEPSAKVESIELHGVTNTAELWVELERWQPAILVLDGPALCDGDLIALGEFLEQLHHQWPQLPLLCWHQRCDRHLRSLLHHSHQYCTTKPLQPHGLWAILRRLEKRYLAPDRPLMLWGFGPDRPDWEQALVALGYQPIWLADETMVWNTLGQVDPLLIVLRGIQAPSLARMLRRDAHWGDRPLLVVTDDPLGGVPWYQTTDRPDDLVRSVGQILD